MVANMNHILYISTWEVLGIAEVAISLVTKCVGTDLIFLGDGSKICARL